MGSNTQQQEIRVFYAWQADRDRKTNRHLIEEAAKTALERISDDSSIPFVLRLDYDTKNVPGTPAITDTILEKIDNSQILLADLTYVARTEPIKPRGKRKLIPNPNVLFELGYAFKVLGSERIICLMNTAYGAAKHQIFDLAHRQWPIRYKLHPGQKKERPSVRDGLSKKIELAIRVILNSGLVTEEMARLEKHEIERLQEWVKTSKDRWTTLVAEKVAEERPSRYHFGVWTAAYSIVGDFTPRDLDRFKKVLIEAEHHGTGWPVWWASTDNTEFPTYFYENRIECWMKNNARGDAAHSDFWTASPDGRLFLLRGYREDCTPEKADPGSVFWHEIASREVAECVLHAKRLATALAGDTALVMFSFKWEGIKDRVLTSWNASKAEQNRFKTRVCRQEAVRSPVLTVPIRDIEENLFQIVEDLTRPLYTAFQMPALPRDRIQQVVTEMKESLA